MPPLTKLSDPELMHARWEKSYWEWSGITLSVLSPLELSLTTSPLRNDDGNGNGYDNATTQRFNWLKKNNRGARAARFLLQFFLYSGPNNNVTCSYLRFWWQRKPAAVNLSFFALAWKPCIRAEQAKVHFIYFALRDQHAIIIPKQLPYAKFFFKVTFSLHWAAVAAS